MPFSIHQAYPKQLANLRSLPAFSSLLHIPDQRIDLHAIHIIQFLQCLLDLPLVRLHIAYENQRVVLLNLLHRAFGIQRVDYHLVVI